jgi:hypothetical protein
VFVDPTTLHSIAGIEAGELPVVTAEQTAAQKAHPDGAIAILGKGAHHSTTFLIRNFKLNRLR